MNLSLKKSPFNPATSRACNPHSPTCDSVKNMKYLIFLLLLIPLNTTPSQAIYNKPLEIIGVDNISGTETEFNIRVLSKINDFDEYTAVKIAECESQFGKYKVNWQGSSAYGLYQFMPSTFNDYCEGYIENDIDQINCFIKLYIKYHHWWECKV